MKALLLLLLVLLLLLLLLISLLLLLLCLLLIVVIIVYTRNLLGWLRLGCQKVRPSAARHGTVLPIVTGPPKGNRKRGAHKRLPLSHFEVTRLLLLSDFMVGSPFAVPLLRANDVVA